MTHYILCLSYALFTHMSSVQIYKVILSFNVGHLLNFKHSTPNFECEHAIYTTDLLRIVHKFANWDVPMHLKKIV